MGLKEEKKGESEVREINAIRVASFLPPCFWALPLGMRKPEAAGYPFGKELFG